MDIVEEMRRAQQAHDCIGWVNGQAVIACPNCVLLADATAEIESQRASTAGWAETATEYRDLLVGIVAADHTPADDDAEVCVYLPVDLWRRLREAVGK